MTYRKESSERDEVTARGYLGSAASGSRGFTIVELLIVIVIIAILAVLTVVGYRGLQSRASDSAVMSDLGNLSKKIKVMEITNGSLPQGGQRSGNTTAFPGVTFAATKAAYDTSVNNLSYCEGIVGGSAVFAITAKSKSGTVYRTGSFGVLKNLGNVSHNTSTACAGMDVGSTGHSYGFYTTSQRWVLD